MVVLTGALVLVLFLIGFYLVNLPKAPARRAAGHGYALAFEPPPPLVLWVGERPERLGFLADEPWAGATGVASLVATVTLAADGVRVRHQPRAWSAPDGAGRIAVVRLEVDRARPPALSPLEARDTAEALLALIELPGHTGLQIDFDAGRSERRFYRWLVEDLARRLPRVVGLSLTAHPSWCLDDPWIRGLPVDEAVPMLFRMGPEGERIRAWLAAGGDFSLPICRDSVGLATHEAFPLPSRLAGRRLYLFHPDGWNEPALARAVSAFTGREVVDR